MLACGTKGTGIGVRRYHMINACGLHSVVRHGRVFVVGVLTLGVWYSSYDASTVRMYAMRAQRMYHDPVHHRACSVRVSTVEPD